MTWITALFRRWRNRHDVGLSLPVPKPEPVLRVLSPVTHVRYTQTGPYDFEKAKKARAQSIARAARRQLVEASAVRRPAPKTSKIVRHPSSAAVKS